MPRFLLDPVISMVPEQQLAMDGIIGGTFRSQGASCVDVARLCITCITWVPSTLVRLHICCRLYQRS